MIHTKNWVKAFILFLSVHIIPVANASAEGLITPSSSRMIEEKANTIYKEINFGNFKKISKEVFIKGYHGYLNLRQSGQLDNDRDVLTICDFSLSSNVPRLWVIDLKKKKVLFNSLVAHGQGSGEEFATSFSNTENSHQSSMGFYVTDNTYYGDKGYSLKLQGKDAGYNDQAYNRAVVIHGADYVSYGFIQGNQRLGRSWGCPALPVELTRPIIDNIKGGTALFIYAPNRKYLASSRWLNKSPSINMDDLLLPNENKMIAENSVLSAHMDTVKPVIKPKAERKPVPAEAYFQ
ncbi:hypothetical protein DBR32_00440 [Taibaiella sp. KBW10]|uniref:murein L,D-transpeptidase catalytic domain family protein n=1 Tax=Taibaiella sp. KBW10 TaxID=2153357 RepID=UPI000F5A74DB|nr:murein L,D-transpeptidase catalytic domain family protein [Taibaiella sp. KBW10]RQO32117.1 hypothetical protein DBR32_00440 [Taibaiella sp. KBW10]